MIEWHALAALEVRWELALREAASLVEPQHVAVRVVSGDAEPAGALLVGAYPAAAHDEQVVSDQFAALRERQAEHPGVRLAAVACGRSNEEVTEMNVQTLLCSDNHMDGRHAFRALDTDDLVGEALGWISAIAHTRSTPVLGVRPLADYSPEALIEEAGAPTTWLGGY